MTAGGGVMSSARRSIASGRLREAFHEMTLTMLDGTQQAYRPLTSLSALQEHILEPLGFSAQAYTTRLCDVSHAPPYKCANRKFERGKSELDMDKYQVRT